MNMFEEAKALETMLKMRGESQSRLAEKIGVSQSYVANKLRLLRLSEEERRAIVEAGLTERHARALLRLEDGAARKGALEKIVRDKLSVARTDALVDFLHDGTAPEKIGRASRLSGIDMFKDTIKSSIASLVGLGVSASHTTGYYGTKTYITICIDEG